MSWDSNIEQTLNQQMAELRSTFLTGWSRMNQLVYPASVEPDNNSPSRQEIANIKANIQQLPWKATELVNQVTNRMNKIIKDTETVSEAVNTQKETVDQLKQEVTKTETIASIRKEQAESLKQKYASNYHSSWIGLWRPLQENTRVALAVVSIMFLIISIACAVFLWRDRVLPATMRNPIGGLVGGAIKFLRRK